MRPPPPVPPALERLLARWLGPDALESVLGDLEEELGPRRGWRAPCFYWRHGVAIALRGLGPAARPARAHRRTGMGEWFGELAGELRLAARALLRQPLFAAVAVATLAIAIGANTALYSVVHGVLLRPLPWPEPERLVRLYEVDRSQDDRRDFASMPNYYDWLEHAPSLESGAAWWTPELTLTGRGEPERLQGALATASLFEVLGVRPALGRSYGPDEDRPGVARVALLGDGLWRRRFGADPNVLGQTLVLDGEPVSVLGVMPPGFGFPTPGTELWLPLRQPRESDPVMGQPWRGFRIVNSIARLAPGASPEQARAELDGLAQRLAREYPEANAGWGVELVPLHDDAVGGARTGLLALLGAVGLVLLIACANLSGLMLARVQRRSRELAVRTALGATRGRLVRQLLVESGLLAAIGGALGVGLGAAALRLLLVVRPAGLPRLESVELSAPVLAFAFGVTLAAALLSGLLPALRAAGGDPQLRLRSGAAGSGASPADVRARRALVVAELALATALLVGSGLLLRSLLALASVDPGFSSERVDAVSWVQPPRSGYSEPAQAARFYERLLERLEATPGVETAGLTLGVPLHAEAAFFIAQSPFALPGRPPADPAQRPSAPLQVASPGFFEALRIPILSGRGFEPGDRRGRPGVALVNHAFARRYFAGASPIGQLIEHELALTADEPQRREIVGVVGDVRFFELESEAPPQIYLPHLQTPWPQMHVVLRGAGGTPPLAAALRAALRELDPEVAGSPPRALAEIASGAVAGPRLRTALLAGFSALALLLAALGLYAVLAYGVASRKREIGVRVAIGARPGDVVRLVVREGMLLAAAGLVLGLLAAAGVSRVVASLLYGTGGLDPAAWLGAATTLAAVALLACWLPARRAAGLDPLVALRGE